MVWGLCRWYTKLKQWLRRRALKKLAVRSELTTNSIGTVELGKPEPPIKPEPLSTVPARAEELPTRQVDIPKAPTELSAAGKEAMLLFQDKTPPEVHEAIRALLTAVRKRQIK
jgi:hypothetical protein